MTKERKMPSNWRVRPLTKRTADTAKPEASRYIIWDDRLKGFGLRVEPTGRKTFIARYRAGGGRTGVLRQATVGRFGTVTAEEARKAARRLLGSASVGNDPVAEARAKRQAGMTVAEVCDWYLREAEAGRLLGRRGQPIKASTLVSDRTRIAIHVKPTIGKRPVQALSPRDLEEMQASIAAGKTAAKVFNKRPRGGIAQGGSGVGGRTLAMLSAVFQHAVRHRLISTNPARGARKFASKKRKERLTLHQLRSLGAAMRPGNENPTGVAAVRLLCVSGLRRNEALGLRPEWILEAGGVDFPDTKSGAQMRPLGRAAINLIKTQVARSNGAEWVFPADKGDGHFLGLPKVLSRLCKRAGLPQTNIHALRHTFASVAAELGFSELTIAGLLGHAAGSVTAGYVHLDSALVTAADRVSAVIARALDGEADADVVPLTDVAGRA